MDIQPYSSVAPGGRRRYTFTEILALMSVTAFLAAIVFPMMMTPPAVSGLQNMGRAYHRFLRMPMPTPHSRAGRRISFRPMPYSPARAAAHLALMSSLARP